VQAVVKIDEGVCRPDSALQFLPGHNVAGSFQQNFQHVQGLASQAQPYAVPAQLAGAHIQLKAIEAQPARNSRLSSHRPPRR
jgi:hypothetical protein